MPANRLKDPRRGSIHTTVAVTPGAGRSDVTSLTGQPPSLRPFGFHTPSPFKAGLTNGLMFDGAVVWGLGGFDATATGAAPPGRTALTE